VDFVRDHAGHRDPGGLRWGVETPDPGRMSSGAFAGLGWECVLFVVAGAGVEAVVELAEEAVVQVAQGGGVTVSGLTSPIVVGSGTWGVGE
jgi:hypothetical protein